MKARDAAHQRYLDREPTNLGAAETEIGPQRVFYDPNVPLEKLTEEHLWLGGSSLPKTIFRLITRLLKSEKRIAELETRLTILEKEKRP